LRQVTHVDGEATTPDRSPDGNWIAFSLDECTVAMVHPDGSGMRTVPSQTPGGCEIDPAFTPDGSHLIFERYDPTIEDDAVWIMGPNGDDRRRLGSGPGGAANPEISPDGQTTFLSFTPSHQPVGDDRERRREFLRSGRVVLDNADCPEQEDSSASTSRARGS
jgi:Tol biopolymer transport system component